VFIEHKSFQFLLKVSNVATFLVSAGRLFHRSGAAMLKARSPNRCRARGTMRYEQVVGRGRAECDLSHVAPYVLLYGYKNENDSLFRRTRRKK